MSQQQTRNHSSKALRAESCLENKVSEGTAGLSWNSLQFPHSWASLSPVVKGVTVIFKAVTYLTLVT